MEDPAVVLTLLGTELDNILGLHSLLQGKLDGLRDMIYEFQVKKEIDLA